MNLVTILVVRHFGPQISAPYAVFTAICTIISIASAFAVDGVLLRYIQRISANQPLPKKELGNIEKYELPDFLRTLFAFRLIVVTVVCFVIMFGFMILPYMI